mgnify:CR=1 FL=1
MNIIIESCCESLEGVRRAVVGGCSRIELCEALALGGVTPSGELISRALDVASAAGVPVNVLVRPRGGNFVYSAGEEAAMLSSIEFCKHLGVNGVVIGALTCDGDVDLPLMRRLIASARPLEVTFHRAVDRSRDMAAALEDIISLRCERVLTSGHAPDAYSGRFVLGGLVRQARGRIIVMPGCGITPSNLAAIASSSGASEFHGTRLP